MSIIHFALDILIHLVSSSQEMSLCFYRAPVSAVRYRVTTRSNIYQYLQAHIFTLCVTTARGKLQTRMTTARRFLGNTSTTGLDVEATSTRSTTDDVVTHIVSASRCGNVSGVLTDDGTIQYRSLDSSSAIRRGG